MDDRSALVIYLALLASAQLVCSEGGHAHQEGTVTTVHTTSGDAGGSQSAFAGILSSLSPDLIRNLARNPQIASALRGAGIGAGVGTGRGAGASGAAAAAAAEAGGTVQPGPPPPPPVGGGYDYPPPPAEGPGIGGGFGGPGGFPGGFGGFGGFPFFGPYKNLHVSGDFGLYYPFVEKAIVIFFGGILLIVILALLSKAFAKGGLFYDWGSSLSEALAGSASLDIGPIHKSVAGAAAVNAGIGNNGRPQQFAPTPGNMQMTQNVYDSIDRDF